MSEFINLRNYSENTFLTWMPKANEYAKIAKKKGLSAVAITDKNNEHGIIEFYKACQKEDWKEEFTKPLIGVNIIIDETNENILVFPKNKNGYKQYKLIISWINMQLKSSIFDFDKSEREDVFFVLSKETVMIQRDWKVSEIIDFFGKENLYFEFQPTYSQEYFDFLKSNVGIDNIVFSNPTYFIDKEDLETKLIIKAIKDKKTLSEISDDFTEFYFKSKNQLKESFKFEITSDDFEKILSNTTNIVENVNIEIRFGENLIPKFDIEWEDLEIYNKYSYLSKYQMSSDEWYFRYLCYSNFEYRYNYKLNIDQIIELVNKDSFTTPENGLIKTSIIELKELSKIWFPIKKQEIIDTLDQCGKDLIYRLEYELYVIHNMGFDAYFLIVSDYINVGAKNKWIAVWPGRWSAAGAITAYLSKITDIDPIKYWLLFERFLNPSRISLPDIDVDFADINRQDVIEYCANKYGRNQVTAVCTFGTMAARSSIKDVGRALWVDAKEMNRFAQLISSKPWTKLKTDYEENEKFKQAVNSNDIYKQVYDYACKIEGHRRQLWVHACATIIAPEPLTNFSAIQFPPNQKDVAVVDDENAWGNIWENAVITQLEAHDLEELGLLKMDFLGLKNMTVIQNTLKLIKERKGIDIDLAKLELTDKKTYDEVFSKWETTWVFQFESNGMRKYLKQLQADKFEELIAMVSLYRPGPLEFIPSFIDRKHGREPIKYLNPVLKDLMKETYWHCIHWDTYVEMANGTFIKIKDLKDNEKKYIGKKVKSYNVDTSKFEEKKIDFLFNNGKKEFFRLNYGNGKFIDVTLDHKMYVYDNIKQKVTKKMVKDLSENDFLLMPKNHLDTKNNEISKEQALIVAYLLADGELSTQATISFINSDNILLSNMENAVKKEFPNTNIDKRINSKNRKNVLRYTFQDPNNRNYKGELTLLWFLRNLSLKQINYKDKWLNSSTKFIPPVILNSSNEIKAFFIAKLWDCDGGVSKKGRPYYTTISKELHDGIITIINSLWITTSSYISTYENEKKPNAMIYKIHIKDLKTFFNIIWIHISSKEKLNRIKQYVDIDRDNKEFFVPTSLLTKTIRGARSHVWLTKSIKKEAYDYNSELLKNFNFFKFKWIENIWTSIAYDMEIEDNHNYVAGWVMVSNCVYQEQIMLMSQIYSGYSMAEADELRKGIGKKNKAIIAKHETKFIEWAVANWHDHDEAENIYKKVIVPAGSYSFNKSHAACYALIAYWTAYLKVHFASEYITACFMSDYDDQERVDLFSREFIRLKWKVLPPNINASEWNYTLEKDGVIRMWLATIKGIGVAPAQAIESERKTNGKFKDIEDFLRRGLEFVSKKVLDWLVGAGSLDSYIDQNAVIANMKEMTDFAKWKIKKKKTKKIEQKSIFDVAEVEVECNKDDVDSFKSIALPNEYISTLWYEKATRQLTSLWVMVSTHPLTWLSKYVKSTEKNRDVLFGTVNNNYIPKEEKRVNVFGYISDYIISKNSSGRETMTIKILGLDYEIRANLYAEKTEEYRYDIEDSIWKFIDVEGSFSVSTYGRTLNVEKLMVIDPIKHVERMKVRQNYDEKDFPSIEVPYLYNFEQVNPYIKLYVAINPMDDKEKLGGYLKDFKDYLQKQERWAYHILLRDIRGGEKDTKFYIKDYKTIISFFKGRKKWWRIFVEDREQKIPKDSEE